MLWKKLISYKSIEEGIKACFGESVTIKDESYVSGGDINVAKCLKLSNDERDLYNLYHLINHLNLFGGTYYSAVISTIDYYVR